MIDVKETLNSAAERMEMAAMYLAEELSHIRAGRANVAILDGVPPRLSFIAGQGMKSGWWAIARLSSMESFMRTASLTRRRLPGSEWS